METNISFTIKLPDGWMFDDVMDFKYLVELYANHLTNHGFNFLEEREKNK